MSGLFRHSEKLNKGDVLVGIDFSASFSQISYHVFQGEGAELDIETVSTIPGGDSYLIPTALFKRGEVNQWFVGEEALSQDPESGFLVDNLIEIAANGESITIGDETYEGARLVALYLRRILSMAGMSFSINKVTALMISVETLTTEMVAALREAVELIGLKTENVFFQNHMESFYYYAIYSPQELWNRNVLLYDFSGSRVKSYMLECNKKTTPIVAYISDITYETVELGRVKNPDITEKDKLRLDSAFYIVCEETTRDTMVSSIYLIGDNFDQDIFKDSVRFLCKRGRVFGGNNLYSKGACFSALNKLTETEVSKSHVFLGNDKLKSNIGVNAYKRGEQAYLPLLDAGENWFEASRELDLILDKENKLDFIITPLTGKSPLVHEMVLNDFPKRPQRTSRIRLNMHMISEKDVEVKVTDLGFGELFPAGNTEWSEVITFD